ncbi:MAG TPA: hypothetical protein VF066_14045 [Thermoleophilaceae bacterium]
MRIREGCRTDRDVLVRGFERLSPESRHRRLLTPMHELDARRLRYLTDLDHRDREAMVALYESGEGVARYVRNNARPDTAEVAVTVVDSWQGTRPWHAPVAGDRRARATRGSGRPRR